MKKLVYVTKTSIKLVNYSYVRKKKRTLFPKGGSQLRSRVSITETTEFNNCTLVCDDEIYPAIVCFPIVSNLYYPFVPPKKSTVISFSKRETNGLYY